MKGFSSLKNTSIWPSIDMGVCRKGVGRIGGGKKKIVKAAE